MVNDILKVNVHGGSHTSLVINGLIKLMSFLRINISKDKMAIHYTNATKKINPCLIMIGGSWTKLCICYINVC